MDIISDSKFDSKDFSKEDFVIGIYEYSSFVNCTFSEVDISSSRFLECEFIECNMSLATIRNVAFQNVRFRGCKMLGLHFEDCDDIGFEVSFDSCTLNHSSFYGRKAKKTTFKDCSIQEVDFTGCDLSESTFSGCDLSRATFDNTNLKKVDFRTSYGFIIDPAANLMSKATFSQSELKGLLSRYDIVID